MLARLSIRDIVLIDRLDIDFGAGLAALTGETGAGKSILLDAFALALGARGDAALVREGAEQGQVIAAFDVAKKHPARRVLAENDIADDDELILRRTQFADGRTRAFVNDQPVSVQVLKALGTALVEIHGQHDDRAFVDAATHRALLDAYGGLEAKAAEVERLWDERRASEAAVESHRAEVERARREADWLRHAVEELSRLAALAGEETTLADRRAGMMQAEKVVDDLRGAYDSLTGSQSPVPPLSTAVRRLERRAAQAPSLIEPVVKAIDAALNALEEARAHLDQALRAADHDPHELERIEERLFALRAAGRKYNVPVDDLAALAQRYEGDLALIDAGAERLTALEAAARAAAAKYRAAAEALSADRKRVRRQARQGGQRRAQAAQARTRQILHRDRERDRGAERPRPHRILGAHQPRHAAGADDEGRLGRRARALSARAQGGAGRSRLGADAGVRRDRYRRGRRRGRCHRRAAGAACRDACRSSP